jgi:hypothetical protein
MAFDTPAKERKCCVNDRFVLYIHVKLTGC